MKIKFNMIGFTAFLILGLLIGLLKPFQPDLEPQGHYVLMMFLITIGLWIFKPFGVPFSVSSVLFAAFLLVLGLSPNIIFSG